MGHGGRVVVLFECSLSPRARAVRAFIEARAHRIIVQYVYRPYRKHSSIINILDYYCTESTFTVCTVPHSYEREKLRPKLCRDITSCTVHMIIALMERYVHPPFVLCIRSLAKK